MSHVSRRRFVGAAAGAAFASAFNLPRMLKAAGTPTTKTVILPIAPRLQWNELNGYCGECSIQQAALYFGTYVSQAACRAIVNPNQQTEVLVAVNDQTVLAALRLTSAEYNYNLAPAPQFPSYFAWIKQHIQAGHPVMIVAFADWGTDPSYDHIMLATGFSSIDSTTYHPNDRLYFNDNFYNTPENRTASTLADTQAMAGNGAHYEFCLPLQTDYGCAVTGIWDASHAALPVQIYLRSSSEPDLIAGAHPIPLDAIVTVTGLTIGQSYSLYRYNDYHSVPTQDYSKSHYTTVTKFVPTKTVAAFSVGIPSNSVAVFRCLPAGK